MVRRPALRLLSVSLLAASAACAPSSDLPGSGSTGTEATTAGAGGSTFTASSGAGGDAGLNPDSACASVSQKAKSTPLSLYIMMDKSSSMAGDKWNSATTGLSQWVVDPNAAGVLVGLRFFPRNPDTTPACDQLAYKQPIVPFAALPGNANALTTAMNNTTPDGFDTPIYPALGGALLECIDLEQQSPGQTAAVLLVTDGVPQGPASSCGSVNPNDPQVIADLAKTGASYNPPVRTFVIGLPGVDQSFANLVAAAGGTGTAILIGSTNVAAAFENALAQVLGEALPCTYVVPTQVGDGSVHINEVNVQITSGSGQTQVIPEDPTCSGDGWKYDDPSKPGEIVLCPQTCSALRTDFKASIQILLGCTTLIK